MRTGGRISSQRLSALAGATLAAVVMSALPSNAQDQASLDAGEKLFSKCKACHEIGEGARNKVGPHLDGLIGRTAGTVDGFRYSSAMVEAGAGGMVWSAETLDRYLEKPRDFIPGNRMSMRGISDPGERSNLIDWLAAASAAEPGGAEPESAAESSGDAAARSFTDIVLALEGDPDYGEYLSGECVTCHQITGHADGIPSIVGLPRDYFIRSLFEYKNNIRSNEVMKLRVANLANEEIAALAAYFGSLEPN